MDGLAKVGGKGFCGPNPEGLDHFPGAGVLRGGAEEEDGFSPKPRLGASKVSEFCLRGTGLLRLSTLTGGSGLAHFEMGGAHFPIPAGVDDVSGDGGAVDLLLGKPHPSGCALTCVKQCVSV